ncbi:hypothetical protein KIN34_06145 [Cellulomonas sp. DKR-3]|uniref:Uncharacterized protein n=1 Tax=Cellulomonas fulva TaxID=2835530 RepID=A0ABS5TXI1_9CELL|nr:hypothetical protein [Cellulomonas fulva]MBT0993866.1 hypothetical protein [Cellulomonas fulva]
MDHASTVDWVVFVLVVGARLVVPLLIGRFPLPAILAALVVDGVDKSLFEAFTDLDLENYQSYDKALDVYYLAVAYLAVLRNWRDRFSVGVVAALWYYRLVGVLAFELTDARWLLVVFPNTFEYVVIAIEVVRTRWDQRRMSGAAVLGLAAVIWVVVKLPQEWWIHVAQRDVTDELGKRPWVGVLLVVLGVTAAVVVRRLWSRLPRPDWRFTLDADEVSRRTATRDRDLAPRPTPRPGPRAAAVTRWAVGEKVVLVGLVTTILVSSYPRIDARWWAAWAVVAGTVLVHAALQGWRLRSGHHGPTRLGPQLAANTLISLVAIVALTALVSGGRSADVPLVDAVLIAWVVALVTTLYDRWVPSAWTDGPTSDGPMGPRPDRREEPPVAVTLPPAAG